MSTSRITSWIRRRRSSRGIRSWARRWLGSRRRTDARRRLPITCTGFVLNLKRANRNAKAGIKGTKGPARTEDVVKDTPLPILAFNMENIARVFSFLKPRRKLRPTRRRARAEESHPEYCEVVINIQKAFNLPGAIRQVGGWRRPRDEPRRGLRRRPRRVRRRVRRRAPAVYRGDVPKLHHAHARRERVVAVVAGEHLAAVQTPRGRFLPRRPREHVRRDRDHPLRRSPRRARAFLRRRLEDEERWLGDDVHDAPLPREDQRLRRVAVSRRRRQGGGRLAV